MYVLHQVPRGEDNYLTSHRYWGCRSEEFMDQKSRSKKLNVIQKGYDVFYAMHTAIYTLHALYGS